MSLAVTDLQASKAFYEQLGFSVFAGQAEHHYLIMKNGQTLIGLFQGMFEQNILTFNPGWDQDAAALKQFEDVREIHGHLKKAGIPTQQEKLENPQGPGSFAIQDPDGNTILIDQHV
ncbi:VOC family protein [Robiginitalea sp. IMCC44478]|uniref:VOC family protein n=1 Tax=Robiginitalea sp. IMCC44478 TaxID=3459122 RepID=UPI004041A6A1